MNTYSILDQLHIPLRIFSHYIIGKEKSIVISISPGQVTVKHESLEPYMFDLADLQMIENLGWRWKGVGIWVFEEGTKVR